MQASEIRDMNEAEIQRHLDEYRHELFNLRFQIATRKLKNHQRVKTVRRDMARLLTVIREREIEALYAAEIAELQALNASL
ncbi:MAG TPA: 50S ribosomal protein L29 [Chloroflexia bacterium]